LSRGVDSGALSGRAATKIHTQGKPWGYAFMPLRGADFSSVHPT
jgi:hypothetical protein